VRLGLDRGFEHDAAEAIERPGRVQDDVDPGQRIAQHSVSEMSRPNRVALEPSSPAAPPRTARRDRRRAPHRPLPRARARDTRRRSSHRKIEPGLLLQELLGQYVSDAVSVQAHSGAEHRKRRALLAPFFARGGVEGFAATIEAVARGQLEPILERERKAVASGERKRGEMDFVEFTSGFTVAVMLKMLGVEMNDHSRMIEWFEAWVAAEGNISQDPQIHERALRAKQDFTEFFEPLLAERRTSKPGNDLLSKMLEAELDGFSLPDDEIRSFIAGMMVAGGETTDHQLGWLMYELIQQPDVQDALVDDRSLMDRALAEGMRHCAIVQYIGRAAPEDLAVEGVKIEKDAPLALVLAAGNRDPRRFKDPDEFDIYRDDHDPGKAFNGAAEHLAFSTGAHFCIGSHLTKAEMETALNLFFDNVRDVRLADGFEPHANPEAVFVRALPSLKISFELR
jgi:cytochrome P450